MTNVCNNCQERHTACWGTCPKYLEARQRFEEAKKIRSDNAKTEDAIKDIQFYGYLKRVKKWRKQL